MAFKVSLASTSLTVLAAVDVVLVAVEGEVHPAQSIARLRTERTSFVRRMTIQGNKGLKSQMQNNDLKETN